MTEGTIKRRTMAVQYCFVRPDNWQLTRDVFVHPDRVGWALFDKLKDGTRVSFVIQPNDFKGGEGFVAEDMQILDN
jgi:cold shock CspA family protein